MPRGRPKGSKNKDTQSVLTTDKLEVSSEALADFSEDEMEIMRRYRKCVQNALDSHPTTWSKMSESLIREVTTLLLKEIPKEFTLVPIPRRQRKSKF